MLRQRDHSRNDHQQNGIQKEDESSSSTRKYGVLGCILISMIVAYYVFSGNSSSSSSGKDAKLNVEELQSRMMSLNKDMSQKLGAKGLKMSPFNLKPKILSDLNPTDEDKLQRLMKREDKLTKMKGFNNKLNGMFGHGMPGMGPLSSMMRSRAGEAIGQSMGLNTNVFNDDNDDVSDLDVKEISFTLNDIFIREVYPLNNNDEHEFVLIFLHGAAYTSSTWIELGILSELAKQGYTSYAIDIAGYGQSTKTRTNDNKWLIDVISKLLTNNGQETSARTDNKKFVLVTPSMSGQYALKVLFDNDKNPKLLKTPMVGMITVAPVSTDKYKKNEYEKVKIPILIIYGENDKNIGLKSKENLIQIPNHKIVEIPNGEHAAYKTNPQYFHEQIVKWLTETQD